MAGARLEKRRRGDGFFFLPRLVPFEKATVSLREAQNNDVLARLVRAVFKRHRPVRVALAGARISVLTNSRIAF